MCDQCDKTFIDFFQLRSHKRVHNNEKSFSCDQCDKTFAREPSLKSHKESHQLIKLLQSVYENICSKIWSCVTRKSAHWHKQTKSNQISVQPHVCEICQKHFSQIDQLKTHKRVHTGVKPHKCPQCDKCFSQTGTLMCHKLSHAREGRRTICDAKVKPEMSQTTFSCKLD